MLEPSFPFLGKQIILTTDRVTLHSKTDGIFLFGKGVVALSSPATINLDSNEKVLIDSPKIELGSKAEALGEPVVLGRQLNQQLLSLCIQMTIAGSLLNCVSDDPKELGSSMQFIRDAGYSLAQEASRLRDLLVGISPILSTTTYTR
jgi:hypothetical protein